MAHSIKLYLILSLLHPFLQGWHQSLPRELSSFLDRVAVSNQGCGLDGISIEAEAGLRPRRRGRPVVLSVQHVTPSTVVRDLGIYLDSDVSMRAQVSRTVSHCFCILRQLHSIRRSLPDSVFQSLIAALVLTKLDFGNATLAGIPSFQLNGLQAIMNAAARLAFQSGRYDQGRSDGAFIGIYTIPKSGQLNFLWSKK